MSPWEGPEGNIYCAIPIRTMAPRHLAPRELVPRIPVFGRLAETLACMALLSGWMPAIAPTGRQVSDGGPATLARCAVREVSRTRLTVEGGRPMYVQADALVADGRGDVLLAGTTSYLWRVAPDGRITGLASDSVFGAVIARGGSARVVPAPMDPRQINGIRAAGRTDGGWDVVFAEVPPYRGDARPGTAARLWYGVYDGTRWGALEQIPTPEGARLDAVFTSSLVRRGDSLAWALPRAMDAYPRDVVLVQRRGGRWSHETVPTRSAVDVDLSYSDAAGLLLAVVQPDPSLQADGNSLLLWSQRPEWRIVRRLVHGYGDGRVYEPALVRQPGGDLLVSWTTPVGEGPQSRRELRALAGRLEVEQVSAVALDPDVSIWSAAPPLLLAGGAPLWAAHHPLPGDEAGEIRFVGLTGRSPAELGRIPNPYRLRMSSAAPVDDGVLVTGMEYTQDRFAFSLLIRARLECENGP